LIAVASGTGTATAVGGVFGAAAALIAITSGHAADERNVNI
jgi:hypothetical protein